MNDESAGQIFAFGNPDRSADGFPDREDLIEYIKRGVFESESGRYRQTAIKPAKVIILSRDGMGYGHFDIADSVPPTAGDKAAYKRVKRVYLVSRAVLYERPVRLYDFGIRVRQFGAEVTSEQFNCVVAAAGKRSEFVSAASPTSERLSPIELERVFREVRDRLRQSEFRQSTLNDYNSTCVVTGLQVPEALEAAHIDPWCSSRSHAPGNGLLMRCDVHALFDQFLLTLHPDDLSVCVSSKLTGTEYGKFNGRASLIPNATAARIDRSALQNRWKHFKA